MQSRRERLDRAVSVAIVIAIILILAALVWWGSTPA
jgi:membrane protein involved in colicin uptake